MKRITNIMEVKMKNSKIFKLVLALTLAVITMASIIPCCFAAGSSDISEIMENFVSGVKKPSAKYVLDEPEEMVVKTKYGNLGYILTSPSSKANKLGTVDEAEWVTVFAKQSGYALAVVDSNGTGGWIKLDILDDEYYSGPCPEDVIYFDGKNWQKPQREDYIDDYETMYVVTKHGIRANLLSRLSEGKTIAYAEEGNEVTVIARRKAYAFIIDEDGDMGWIKASLLKYDY